MKAMKSAISSLANFYLNITNPNEKMCLNKRDLKTAPEKRWSLSHNAFLDSVELTQNEGEHL